MTKPIQITHVITDLDTGGAEMMLFKILKGIDRSIIRSRVISLTDSGAIGKKITDLGVEVECLQMKTGRIDPFAIARLAKIIKKNEPAVVQTWMYHADLIGGLAALLAGRIPTVWNIRNSTLDRETSKASTRMVVNLNERLSHWLPARVIVCSERALQVHVSLGYDAKRMRMIPNGFNLDEFQPNPDSRRWLRNELKLPENCGLIGLVARFDPQKDLSTFIDAARIVNNSFPDLHYILCGDRLDSDNNVLAGWINQTGLLDRFHLLGRRNDIPQITAGFDLAVSSSAYGEAFSNVIGEAMACAVPCVVTDVGDAAAIVADTGRVVAPRNPHMLASAILEMMNLSPQARSNMGMKARERIIKNYDLTQIVASYTDVYLELLP